MYFFYIDESGNRDVKKTDEPYVLTAVGMYENQWRGFNTHLNGMKTNLARQYSPDIRQNQMKVKSNFITKPRARNNSPFFSVLSDEDSHHISAHYLNQLDRAKMCIVASVIDKAELREGTTGEQMHEWAYKLLLERIQHFMGNKHNALIIMDDAGANLNRSITLMHARLLNFGNEVMDFRNIIEYPFFVSSELSNGVQLADLVAYTIYHTFRYEKPDYEFMQRIRPYISRLAENEAILAGLKIWPASNKYQAVFDQIQRRSKADEKSWEMGRMRSGWANHIELIKNTRPMVK